MSALSPRLAAAARWVLPGRPLADIGTDHAYLPAHLVRTGIIPFAIAGDLMPGPLEAARATLVSEALQDRVQLRLGSGLRILQPGEVATASLCGMGGPLIARLLSEGPLEGIRRLVLQPMGGEQRLRSWLGENGWRLVGEELVEDAGRIYVVLAAEPGRMELTDLETLVGPLLRERGGPLFAAHLGSMLRRARRAREGALRSPAPEAGVRAEELRRRIATLEEVLRDEQSNRRDDHRDH